MQLQDSFLVKATYVLLFFILLVYSLTAARAFLVPLFAGILLAFLLYPLSSLLESKGVPRILANLIAIIFGIAVVAGAVYFIYAQLNFFVQDFPKLKAQALENLKHMEMAIQQEFGVSVERQDQWLKNFISQIFASGDVFFKEAFTTTASTITKIGLMPIYVFFLLYYRNKFAEFLLRITPTEKHPATRKILQGISSVTKHYMGGITMVVLILCVLNSIGLLIVGIQYALLLGVISAMMNFIPYFGTLIGGAFPLIISLITEDSPRYAFGVILLFIIIQFIENNILTPNIVGSNVRINPFFTILTIILGGLLWGIPGMFIILPFLAMFKIVCEHVEALKPFAFLLSTQGTEQHALTWKKVKKVIRKQRQRINS